MKKTILIAALLITSLAVNAQSKKPVKPNPVPVPVPAANQQQIQKPEKQVSITLTYFEALTIRQAILRVDSLLSTSPLPYNKTAEMLNGNILSLQILTNSYNRAAAVDTVADKPKK